jgi:hypothetical protein
MTTFDNSNKRKIGDDFENQVLKKLGSNFKKTAGSGSVFKDGDMAHSRLVVECKVKNNTKSFSITKKELDHLTNEADKQAKDWLFIETNADGRIMVLTELDTLIEMSYDWKDSNGNFLIQES